MGGAVLYVPDVETAPDERARAWRPDVPGVGEVLHAHFTEHAYPAHTHDLWTVLLVDTGVVDYAMDGRPRNAPAGTVSVLPPDVPHDGRSAAEGGFDKRVVYVDERWLPPALTGAAVDRPVVADADLGRAATRLHDVMARPGDELEAESRLALVAERIQRHLTRGELPTSRPDPVLARQVRDRLDAELVHPPSLEDLALDLGVHPTHVVRAFGRAYGIAPHRYVTGRRIDRARRLLLDGVAPAEVAVEVGFHDQSHLTRHFRRLLGTTPQRWRVASR